MPEEAPVTSAQSWMIDLPALNERSLSWPQRKNVLQHPYHQSA
jgi:hypothetical protein